MCTIAELIMQSRVVLYYIMCWKTTPLLSDTRGQLSAWMVAFCTFYRCLFHSTALSPFWKSFIRFVKISLLSFSLMPNFFQPYRNVCNLKLSHFQKDKFVKCHVQNLCSVREISEKTCLKTKKTQLYFYKTINNII